MTELFGADVHQEILAIGIFAVEPLDRILHRCREFAIGAAELLQKHVAEAYIGLVDAHGEHQLLDVVIHRRLLGGYAGWISWEFVWLRVVPVHWASAAIWNTLLPDRLAVDGKCTNNCGDGIRRWARARRLPRRRLSGIRSATCSIALGRRLVGRGGERGAHRRQPQRGSDRAASCILERAAAGPICAAAMAACLWLARRHPQPPYRQRRTFPSAHTAEHAASIYQPLRSAADEAAAGDVD